MSGEGAHSAIELHLQIQASSITSRGVVTAAPSEDSNALTSTVVCFWGYLLIGVTMRPVSAKASSIAVERI